MVCDTLWQPSTHPTPPPGHSQLPTLDSTTADGWKDGLRSTYYVTDCWGYTHFAPS